MLKRISHILNSERYIKVKNDSEEMLNYVKNITTGGCYFLLLQTYMFFFSKKANQVSFISVSYCHT